MSRHAGHETNSARPRVSSPSRRRRASQGTTSDAVANRTIQATIPRRDPDTISGGEAARGVMTVPIEVPSRRRSAAKSRAAENICIDGPAAVSQISNARRTMDATASWKAYIASSAAGVGAYGAECARLRDLGMSELVEAHVVESTEVRPRPSNGFFSPTPPSIANNDDSIPFPLSPPAPPDRVRVRPPPAHVRSLRSRERRRPPRGPPRPILVLGRRRRPRRRVGE